jgi:hypothetical protein
MVKKVVFVLTLTLTAIWSARCDRQGPLAAKLQSPNGNYTVNVIGVLTRPTNMFIQHPVKFEVRSENTGLTARGDLYMGDSYDEGFEEKYPQHNWRAENILRFFAQPIRQSNGQVTATITNDSSRQIAYLKIIFVDLFLIFDLKPQQTVSLDARPYPSDRVFLSVAGEFRDGAMLRIHQLDSTLSTEKPTFSIAVSENDVTIR